MPVSWMTLLPPIGARATFDPRLWVVLTFRVGPKHLRLIGRVWPTKDASLRKRVVDRLVQDPEEFGFRLFFKNKEHSGAWTTISNESILRWPVEDEPDEEAAVAAVRSTLDRLHERLQQVPKSIAGMIQG